ncbi:MAG: Glycerate kinase, partial [Chloroflexota bacterium]|nr:Glycerate kinase [Chloroflexota bacterium]
MSLTPNLRGQIAAVLEAAIRAVDPYEAIHAHVSLDGDILRIGGRAYHLGASGRILVVGGGKAGAPMAAALTDILGARITAGVVNVKYGHTATASDVIRSGSAVQLGALQLIEAGHPVPDAAGQAGAERIAALLDGLTPHDLVLVLISGGGSALLPLPVAGITLADIQSLTQILLRCGADITEINTIRKHLSGLQGGQLARLAQPASVATLILSDVVGTPLDAIASGPTVPDPTTYADAVAVLQRYGIEDQIPDSVRRHLLAGAAGARPETPKPGDPLFERVAHIVIGDNASAGRAAVAAARRLGFHSTLLTTFIQGE